MKMIRADLTNRAQRMKCCIHEGSWVLVQFCEMYLNTGTNRYYHKTFPVDYLH